MPVSLDDLTIGDARKLASMFAGCTASATPGAAPPRCAYTALVGKSLFIRTVTYHYTGRLEQVTDDVLVLSEVAWIADSGRFAQALATGVLSEVEPYPTGPVIVPRAVIVDVSEWNHPLPRSQK
jgi:hypothetical protein